MHPGSGNTEGCHVLKSLTARAGSGNPEWCSAMFVKRTCWQLLNHSPNKIFVFATDPKN